MKPQLLVLLALLCTVGLAAQVGSIAGTVENRKGEPLQFVNVSLQGTTRGAETDASGAYRLERVPVGDYVLLFSGIGLSNDRLEVRVTDGQTTEVAPVRLRFQEAQLSEIVVRGGRDNYVQSSPSPSLRLQTPIAKLPQNIQVISQELVRDQQITNIMQGLSRNVSGVTMLEHWGNFARINMRGFRIPAFRNGFNVSDSWGPLSEDMSLVDRIEFVKGPAGFMLSAGEPGGLYNVVTKKPTEQSVGEVTLMAGSFDFYRGALDLGGKISENDKLLYRLNGMYQTSDSHRGNEDAQRWAIAPALSYRFSDRTILTAELTHQQAESFLGSAYIFAPVADGYGSLDRDFNFVDPDYPATDITETMGLLNLNHRFSADWQGTVQIARLNYEQEGYSAWISTLEDNGDAYRSVSLWDALSRGNYAQAFVNGKARTGKVTHTVLAGIDYTDKEYYADFYSSQAETTPFNIYDPVYGNFGELTFDRSQDLRDRYPDPYNGFRSTALYLQDELGFFRDRLRVTLAGRYTNLETVGKETTDNTFTPRVGISYDVLPDLAIYGLYDESFLPNNGASADGQPFDPVRARDVEGGIKKSFLDGRFRAALGAYRITKNNVLVTDPENTMFSIQLGEIQSQGIEFDLQGELYPGLNLVLNYANTDVTVTEDTDETRIGSRVAGHARHVTNGWLTYGFPATSALRGFGASLGYQYQADRSTWTWGADNETDLPNYFRLDGGLFWKNDRFRVQFNVNNLLDEYLYSGANYGSYLYWQSEPGINGRLAVTYRFL
ncbi:TonB-dependent receptor [Lewinella sp. IMCC34191]|uniref:TonB-dependent receptor n=1 Tax=Lewinella sp. IMCC34191 TaxID=2259172 RepID=UPI000E226F7C|nr:TonB-dependent receptor [Lewinella sp. IMCC34191]